MPLEVARFFAFVPPWVVLAGLFGVINGTACFLLVGQRITRLGWYAALGALAAAVGQVFGTAIQAPTPLMMGDLNLLVASAAVWVVLTAAWLAGVR